MDDDLETLRKLQAERRKIDGQLEGHLKRAASANEAVGADWIDQAACASSQLDSEYWFPSTPGDRDMAKEAIAVCWNECPVRLECLQAACLRRDYGIWGGFLREDRLKHGFDYDILKSLDRR
ncbi:WhiB family transcriptional regulator [Streptomyces sp. NPDC055013]